jgi:hypothetical protein
VITSLQCQPLKRAIFRSNQRNGSEPFRIRIRLSKRSVTRQSKRSIASAPRVRSSRRRCESNRAAALQRNVMRAKLQRGANGAPWSSGAQHDTPPRSLPEPLDARSLTSDRAATRFLLEPEAMTNDNEFTETERAIAAGLFKLFGSDEADGLREQIEVIRPTSPHVAELLTRMQRAAATALQPDQKHNG